MREVDLPPIEDELGMPADYVRCALQHMLAGAIAGILEHTLMFPVDTIKTRMQALAHPGQQASPCSQHAPSGLTSVLLGASTGPPERSPHTDEDGLSRTLLCNQINAQWQWKASQDCEPDGEPPSHILQLPTA